MRASSIFPFLSVLPLVVACTDSLSGGKEDPCKKSSAIEVTEEKEPGGIHRFASEGDLDLYLAKIEAKSRGTVGSGDCEGQLAAEQDGGSFSSSSGSPGMTGASPSAGASEDESSKDGNEEITNNQEQGVDEGGIVKNVGDHLVVLRKGRLFVANVADGQAPSLSDSMRVARTESLNQSVWYDEMLVKGDLVYVIGYRYGIPSDTTANDGYVRGATEVDTFRLTNGKLARLKSMFLESNDYYSGHNYASRMVDGKLVFYMPHYIGRDANKKLVYPRVLTADDAGKFSAVGPIFGALDVFTSLTVPESPTFHTVVQCELPESGELSCHGRSVIGSWWRETYVSPDAVYLWASSYAYRFDFDSLDVSAHAAKGAPTDQFSFRQSADKLLVAVNPYILQYDNNGNPITTEKPALLALPLAAFDKKGEQTPSSTNIAESGFISKNRFVGDVLVASLGSSPYSYYGKPGEQQQLVTIDPATNAIQSATISQAVRIEPLGERRALVVTANSSGITLHAYSVDSLAQPLSRMELKGASEGEGRSHGFFYKPDGNGAGTIGYAVIAPPTSGSGATYGWGNGISNLGFFDVASTGSMSALGIVSAGTTTSECETSCTDWYGNTRPIFLSGRSFALMGSELSEVSVRPTVQRVGSAVVLQSNETALNQQ